MDGTKFDAVARSMASGLTRRTTLRGLVAGAVAAVGGGTALGTASAKKKRCTKAGDLCTKSTQCCPKETGRVCKQPTNASNSDLVCCAGKGATCGGERPSGLIEPRCCLGLECSSRNGKPGTCR